MCSLKNGLWLLKYVGRPTPKNVIKWSRLRTRDVITSEIKGKRRERFSLFITQSFGWVVTQRPLVNRLSGDGWTKHFPLYQQCWLDKLKTFFIIYFICVHPYLIFVIIVFVVESYSFKAETEEISLNSWMVATRMIWRVWVIVSEGRVVPRIIHATIFVQKFDAVGRRATINNEKEQKCNTLNT